MPKKDAEDDEFLVTEFDAATEYIREHPNYALCRVRHDISLHRPPVDMTYNDDGGWTFTYPCGGCNSEHFRRYYADGRFHSSWWKYAEGYIAPPGTGYALISRSGRAAFNLTLRDTMMSQPRNSSKKRR